MRKDAKYQLLDGSAPFTMETNSSQSKVLKHLLRISSAEKKMKEFLFSSSEMSMLENAFFL